MICIHCNLEMVPYDAQPEWRDCFDPRFGHYTAETGRLIRMFSCPECGYMDDEIEFYDPKA